MTKAYLVGGCVRDKFMNTPIHDIDIAVDTPSYNDLRGYILANDGCIFVEKEEFLTIRARMPEQYNREVTKHLGYTKSTPISNTFDFVMTRKEGEYKDGRRPSSVVAGTIEDDMSRRDFTMNAMAIDVCSGELYDPFGGLDDINNNCIRVAGDIETVMSEDSLRVLRALRFHVTLNMLIEDNFRAWIKSRAHDVLYNGDVSAERIYEELSKMFAVGTLKTLNTLNEYSLVKNFVFGDSGVALMPRIRKGVKNV